MFSHWGVGLGLLVGAGAVVGVGEGVEAGVCALWASIPPFDLTSNHAELVAPCSGGAGAHLKKS